MSKSKRAKAISHLTRGRKLTRITAMHEFDIQNLTAMISEIRKDGYNVKLRTKQDARGTPYTEYYFGRPHKKAA